MSIEISPETEARLADEAKRLGTSVDALLERLVDERAALRQPAGPSSGLPVWHSAGQGPFTGETFRAMSRERFLISPNNTAAHPSPAY